LEVPISAFGGLADADISAEQIDGWRPSTRGAFRRRMLPGGHFFLRTERPLLLNLVAADLKASLELGARRTPA
jgi:surfactin synthase thioesterase subunit